LRRVLGLLGTGAGAFLVALALLLRFWVPDQIFKAPLNEYAVTTYTGHDITYFSQASLKEYKHVSATATRTIEGDVKSGSSSVAVWGSFTALQDTTHHVPIQQVSQRSAVNRRTGLLVNCCAAAIGSDATVHQSGQGFRWPFGTRHRTYQVFDVTLKRPVPFSYAGTTTVEGMTADRFVEHVMNLRFGQQTLPGPLVGMKQQATVTLPEYLTATNTYLVDPVTGAVLSVTQDQTVFLKDGTGATRLVLLGGTLTESPASVRAAVASAARSHTLIKWTQDLGPLLGIIAGLVALVAGITVVWRSEPRWDPADDDDGEPLSLPGRLVPL
jgi:hypothetical protein